MPLHESPMVGLLTRQARRRGFDRYRRWTMFAVLLFLAPAVTAVSLDRYSESLEAFLITLAGALALVVPLAQLIGDAGLLASLRKGGCLEEILGTRTSTRELVDQVAFYSVVSVLRMGAAVLVPVLLGLLLLVPPANRVPVLLAGLCWLPLMIGVVWSGSCFVQAVIAWSDRGRLSARALLVAAPLAALVALGLHAALSRMGEREYALALLAVIGSSVVLGVVSRALACRGLDLGAARGGSLRHLLPSRAPRPPAPWRNAIARREAARERVGGVLLQFWVLWLGLGLVAWQVLREPSPTSLGNYHVLLAWSTLMMVAGFLQPLRASLRTAGAVQSERDGRTLETLAVSGLTPAAFVDGWAQAAWLPHAAETALLLLAGGGLLLSFGGGDLSYVLAVPSVLLHMVYGAYLGLLVSTLTRARRDAWLGLLLAWIASVLVLVTAPGIVTTLVVDPRVPLEMQEAGVAGSVLVHVAAAVCGILLVRSACLGRVRALFAPSP